MFTFTVPNTPNWLQHKEHDCSIAPDRLSFGYRSVLVHFSLGPRSSLVRLSFVIR